MSLLNDLLSKVKAPDKRGDVPPGLKQAVSESAKKDATRRKMITLSILVSLSVIAGIGAVYLMDTFTKPATLKRVKNQESGIKSQELRVRTVPQPQPVKPMPQPAKIKAPKKGGGKSIKGTPQPELSPKPNEVDKKGDETPKQSAPNPELLALRDVYLYTARTYESKKDYAQALSNYKKALEIEPRNYVIMNNISSLLLNLGAPEEAIRHAKNALAIKNDYVPSIINHGIASIKLGNTTEGESLFFRALGIEPSNRHALLNLGLVHEKRGEYDKANSYFLKLSEMGDVQGYMGMARIAEKQGKSGDAIRIYRDIASMSGIDPRVRKLANERLLQIER